MSDNQENDTSLRKGMLNGFLFMFGVPFGVYLLMLATCEPSERSKQKNYKSDKEDVVYDAWQTDVDFCNIYRKPVHDYYIAETEEAQDSIKQIMREEHEAFRDAIDGLSGQEKEKVLEDIKSAYEDKYLKGNETSLLEFQDNKTLILYPEVALDREKLLNPQSLAL